MRKLITMLAILVAGVVTAQEANPPTISFQFTCEEVVEPTITLHQDLLDAGWVLNFTNGEAGEITNSAYPGYVIFNTSEDEELNLLTTFSDSWEATFNGDDFTFDNEPVYLGEVIAEIVDAASGNNALGLVMQRFISYVTSPSEFTLDQEALLFELDVLQHAIVAWDGSPDYTLSYAIINEDESAYIKLTDNTDSSKYVSVGFQYHFGIDFVNNVLIVDSSVSVLAENDNSTGLDVTLPAPGNDVDSVIAYLEAVREIVTPLSDIVEEEEEEPETQPILVEIRSIVTVTSIPGRQLIYITDYNFADGVQGTQAGDARVSSLSPDANGIYVYEGTEIYLNDSNKWFLYNDLDGIDEGPFNSFQEALQALVNLTGGIIVVEQPSAFINVTSAEVLSNSSIEITVSVFYYEDGVVGDQFGETGTVIIPQTLRGFGTWPDGDITLSYVQADGTYGIAYSVTGLNVTGLTLEEVAQTYIDLR